MARSFCCMRHWRAWRGSENSADSAAQRDVQEHEGRQQQQQHQVERQVDAVRRPEHRDRALVVAGEQRHRDRDAEQRQEPECGAHGVALSGPPPRWPAPPASRRCAAARPTRDLRLQLLQQRGGGLGAARGRVEILVQRGRDGGQIGARRVDLARQQRQPRIEQLELEVLAQEEGLLGRQQHRLGLVDAADAHQRARLLPHRAAAARSHQGASAGDRLGLPRDRRRRCAPPTALSAGRSSTPRIRSSSFSSASPSSPLALARMRSMSRAWRAAAAPAAAARRARGAGRRPCSAASSGSTLPVSCACCCARRRADSMSTTRFSSRERDRLCISSSSCVRCSATSPTRVSASARRAAVSRAVSCAWRASVRASIDCASASALWRASCSWMPLTFCHSDRRSTSATTATSASSAKHDARQQQAPRRRARRSATGTAPAPPASGTDVVGQARRRSSRTILSTRPARPASAASRAQRPKPASRAASAMRGWVATARARLPVDVAAARGAGWRSLPSC